MPERRWRGAEPPLRQANPLTNGHFNPEARERHWYKLYRIPTRWLRGHIWAPPWPQAAENTNGYFLRPNHEKWLRENRFWIRRGRTWSPPWPQRAENTNGYFLRPNINQKWIRAWRQWPRRGRTYNNPIPTQVVVATTPLPYWVHREAQLQARLPYTRRGHIWQPAWPQSFPPNPSYPTNAYHQQRVLRLAQWQRRGKTYNDPIPPQFNPPLPYWIHREAQLQARIAIEKRGHLWQTIPPQFNPPFQFLVHREAQLQDRLPYTRKGHVWSPHLDQAFPPNPTYPVNVDRTTLRVGWRQWQRRGHIWWPTPTTFLPNPAIVFQVRQPNAELVKRQWQRRGRSWQVWPQANPLTNGYWQPNVDRTTLRVGWRQWQRRGKLWVPVPDQTALQQKAGHKAWPLTPTKRGHFYQSPVPPQFNPTITEWLVRRNYPRNYVYTRRGHHWPVVPTAFVVVNPIVTEWAVRRAYPRNYVYTRRGRIWSPHLDQAFPPNPVITEWWRKRSTARWWFGPRRAHWWQPAWPQSPLGFVPSYGLYFADEFVTTLWLPEETPSTLWIPNDEPTTIWLPDEGV